MADIEKVIKGLEQHMKMSCLSRIEQLQPIFCPYFRDGDCIINMCRDALEVLKEQEAHLITEDDFVNADHYGYIPAWTEERNGDQFWKCITRKSLNSDTKRFKYWSNKPTDEQRKEVKWE